MYVGTVLGPPYRGLENISTMLVQCGLASFNSVISLCWSYHDVFFRHQQVIIVTDMYVWQKTA